MMFIRKWLTAPAEGLYSLYTVRKSLTVQPNHVQKGLSSGFEFLAVVKANQQDIQGGMLLCHFAKFGSAFLC